MKSMLMTGSALLLALGVAGQARAECPADIDAFNRHYDETMGSAAAGGALSAQEQAEIFGLRTTAENMHRAGNQEMCELAIQRAQLLLNTAIAPTVIQPDELVGMDVRNGADEYLGEVEGVMLDPSSGRLAFALVDHGGFLGIGSHSFPVPWRSLTFTPGADALLLDMTEERLEKAPQYLEEETTPEARREWLLAVHSYYGVDPYWQDNLASMAMGGGAAEGAQAGGTTALVVAVPVEGQQAEDAASQPPVGSGAVPQPQAGATQGQQPDALVVTEQGQGGSGAAPAQQGALGAQPEPVVVTEGAGAVGRDPMSELMERLDGLEQRLDEISQQGLGQEARQALQEIQQQVRQLAQSQPAQDVGQAIDQLRQQVEQLAQGGAGQEMQQAIQRLEQEVRQLAESAPGEEVREMLARLESEVRELTDSQGAVGGSMQYGSGSTGGTMQYDQSGQYNQSGQSGQSGQYGQSGSTGGSMQVWRSGSGGGFDQSGPTGGAQYGQSATTGGAQYGQTGGSTQVGQSGSTFGSSAGGQPEASTDGERGTRIKMTVIEPEDDEPTSGGLGASGVSGGGNAGTQGGGSVATQGGTSTQQQASGGATVATGGAGQQAATAGQQAATATGGAGQQAATAGQSAMAPADNESCEVGITRLEQDVDTAEQQGVVVEDARSELESAQAMLRRASEALCRAAIKRAREQLAEAGFQTTQ